MNFDHINELVAYSNLKENGDAKLFVKQRIDIIDNESIQWAFTLRNGEEIFFRESILRLRCSDDLEYFKRNIRRTLTKENGFQPLSPMITNPYGLYFNSLKQNVDTLFIDASDKEKLDIIDAIVNQFRGFLGDIYKVKLSLSPFPSPDTGCFNYLEIDICHWHIYIRLTVG